MCMIRNIKIECLDYEIQSQLVEVLNMTVFNLQGKEDVTEAEFKEVLDAGLRDDLNQRVFTYYKFLGDINVDITDSEYFGLYKVML